MTQNPLAAIHRALRMGTNSWIAVIDLHRAAKIGMYAEDGVIPQIQSVADLHLHIEAGYRGTSEYLLWKEVRRYRTSSSISSLQY